MLPNGEINVNSRYVAQPLHSDTPRIPNPSHRRRNNRLGADVDAHRARWRHSARYPLPVSAESERRRHRRLAQYVEGFQ